MPRGVPGQPTTLPARDPRPLRHQARCSRPHDSPPPGRRGGPPARAPDGRRTTTTSPPCGDSMAWTLGVLASMMTTGRRCNAPTTGVTRRSGARGIRQHRPPRTALPRARHAKRHAATPAPGLTPFTAAATTALRRGHAIAAALSWWTKRRYARGTAARCAAHIVANDHTSTWASASVGPITARVCRLRPPLHWTHWQLPRLLLHVHTI
jgi:hypothetical protein